MFSILAATSTELPDPTGYVAVGWLTFGLFTIAGFVLIGLNIYSHFKPKPPLHKEYATKEELAKLESQMMARDEKRDVEMRHLHKRISDLRDDTLANFGELSKAGEARGDKLMAELKDMRREFKTDTQELHGRITALAVQQSNAANRHPHGN